MKWIYFIGAICVVATLAVGTWVGFTHDDWRISANMSLIYIAVLNTAFTLLYLLRSRWWSNRIGRIFLAKSIVLALVLIQATVATWFDADYPGRQIIRFIIYSAGAVAYVPMIISLVAEQRCDRKAERDRKAEHDG